MTSKIVSSFDNLPVELRKQIFDFVWGNLCYENVLQEWPNIASRKNVKHLLFKFFNNFKDWTLVYAENYGGGTTFVEKGFSNKMASIYLRHPRIEGIQEAKDYILERGLNGIVLWGLLKHSEREAFMKFIREYTEQGLAIGINGIICIRVSGFLTQVITISRF